MIAGALDVRQALRQSPPVGLAAGIEAKDRTQPREDFAGACVGEARPYLSGASVSILPMPGPCPCKVFAGFCFWRAGFEVALTISIRARGPGSSAWARLIVGQLDAGSGLADAVLGSIPRPPRVAPSAAPPQSRQPTRRPGRPGPCNLCAAPPDGPRGRIGDAMHVVAVLQCRLWGPAAGISAPMGIFLMGVGGSSRHSASLRTLYP